MTATITVSFDDGAGLAGTATIAVDATALSVAVEALRVVHPEMATDDAVARGLADDMIKQMSAFADEADRNRVIAAALAGRPAIKLALPEE